jgi:hypothetical protein
MAKDSNKEIERYYFEMFRRDYRLPEGTVVYTDKPDVILEGKRNIGIEITNFYHESGALPESEQVQKRTREIVISEAQKFYLEKGGKKFELSFSFDPNFSIRNRRLIVNKIAALAKKIEESTTGSISRGAFNDIPQLSFVYLNAEECEFPKWRLISSYPAPDISLEKLYAIVRSKEEKSIHYQQCEVYWLLIVVNFFDTAQDQEIQINSFERVDTQFEKVIVYKPHFGHILQAK